MPKSVRVPLSRCTHFKAQPRILTQSLTHTHSRTLGEQLTLSHHQQQQQQQREYAARPGSQSAHWALNSFSSLIQPYLYQVPLYPNPTHTLTHFACHQTHN